MGRRANDPDDDAFGPVGYLKNNLCFNKLAAQAPSLSNIS
jgi:hypothetical protein